MVAGFDTAPGLPDQDAGVEGRGRSGPHPQRAGFLDGRDLAKVFAWLCPNDLVWNSVRGAGRPLLLIMGLGGNIERWDPLERALNARGVQTVAYDASGAPTPTSRACPAPGICC